MLFSFHLLSLHFVFEITKLRVSIKRLLSCIVVSVAFIGPKVFSEGDEQSNSWAQQTLKLFQRGRNVCVLLILGKFNRAGLLAC